MENAQFSAEREPAREAVFLADKVVVFSPRPGRIVEGIDIDLPRPRKLSVRESPAFGAYTGGLSIRDAAFAQIFQTMGFMAHVLGDNRMHAISASRCY